MQIRRKHICMALVCLLLSSVGVLASVWAQAPKQAPENLVVNCDFENLNTEPWWLWIEDWENVEAAMKIVDGESLVGSRSLLVEITKKGGGKRIELHQGGHGRPAFNLRKGQKLTYAFWAKTEEGKSLPATMWACHREPPWTKYCQRSIRITDEWTDFWAPVNVHVDDDLVGIYVEFGDNRDVYIWFDYFRLYEGDYIDEFPRIAVEPRSKVSSLWGNIRQGR